MGESRNQDSLWISQFAEGGFQVFTMSAEESKEKEARLLAELVQDRAWNEGYPKIPEDFTITEKAPTRAFSWLKAPTSAFTFKTLLRHYAKRMLTPH